MVETIEICCDNIYSCIAAETESVDRIELCSSLEMGGLTPSAGLIKRSREVFSSDIHVLIRPRGGDFLYSTSDLKVILSDIDFCCESGIDGIVFGALNKDGLIDSDLCEDIIDYVHEKGMSFTFHRAFDLTPNLLDSLNVLVKIGADRVLTSGGRVSAYDGRDTIAQLVKMGQGRIGIIAGGGVRSENVSEIVCSAGVREIHLSASVDVETKMIYRDQPFHFSNNEKGDFFVKVSDNKVIQSVVKSLQSKGFYKVL